MFRHCAVSSALQWYPPCVSTLRSEALQNVTVDKIYYGSGDACEQLISKRDTFVQVKTCRNRLQNNIDAPVRPEVMLRYIFIFAFTVIFRGVTLAQFVPEVDSLLKARAGVPYEQENTLAINHFSHMLFARYGAATVQQQIDKVLSGKSIPVDNKILFAHILPPMVLETPGNTDSVLLHFIRALRKAYDAADNKCKAFRLLEVCATLYNMEKRYAQAKEIYDFIEAELHASDCGTAFIAFHLGISRSIYMPLGNHALAAEHYLQAFQVLDSLKHAGTVISPYYEYSVYNEMANLNYHTGRFHEAISYWQKALLLIDLEDKWTNGVTGIYNNIGIAYRKLKQYDKAKEFLRECIRRAEKTNDRAWIGIATGNVGAVLAEEGNYPEAIPLLEKDIRISAVNFQYGSLTNAYAKVAFCYSGLGNYPKAKAYYDSAVWSFERWPKPIAFGTYTYSSLMELYRTYADMEFQFGNYKAAYLHKRMADVYNDSLKNMQRRQEISLLQSYYKFEKQVDENKLLKAKVKTQQLRESVIIVLILLGGIVLIFIVLLYQLRLRKASAEAAAHDAARQIEIERALRLQEELTSAEHINALKQRQAEERLSIRERELSSITVQIQQKNEVMFGLKTQLEKIASKGSALQDDFKTLYKSVRKDLNLSSDWDKFKVHFEQVHPDFFAVLNRSHPEISLSDLRICAYLRMNMDNATIAHILNVSTDSLRVRRHRLRKRMGFQTDKEIYNYLASL
jgi:tetratricopeptide (TPR) repeat protein